ncbi:MAG: helix-turn-helix transcriptional regulator [Chitinophagaceae bacterium]|nr:helix-turn-helix transcriptional regulator [Chitinophagaceae bacterium]
MIKISYDTDSFNDLLPAVARAFKTKNELNNLTIDNELAKGYCWTFTTTDNINLVVFECLVKEEMDVDHFASHGSTYILSFIEASSTDAQRQPVKKVNLYNGSADIHRHIPANTSVRLLMIFIERKHLLQLMDEEAVDALLSNYFERLLKNGKASFPDTDYRGLLEELIAPEIKHPLKHHFIANRIMLLVEKFVTKNLQKREHQETSFSDSEISRLMKVEGILVKDFSLQPPTIDELSKISAMSPTKLKKDFKCLYGLPIYEYFQKNRMIKARMMISSGEYSIKQVGRMVGYTNLSHFASSFKKEFGILPSELSIHAEG